MARKKNRSHDGGVGLFDFSRGIVASDRGVKWAFERFVGARDDKPENKNKNAPPVAFAFWGETIEGLTH